jgi:protein-tyrosine phosphatase
MLREVTLPKSVSGQLWLHSMPGRHEPLTNTWTELGSHGIVAIICLADSAEIRSKSPEYAKALDGGTAPCEVVRYEIPDFGVPTDRPAFWAFALKIAERLRSADNLMIHCGAGIGRTGTLAECVLLALGEEAAAAHVAVERAGSGAETYAQRELILWSAEQAARADR